MNIVTVAVTVIVRKVIMIISIIITVAVAVSVSVTRTRIRRSYIVLGPCSYVSMFVYSDQVLVRMFVCSDLHMFTFANMPFICYDVPNDI